MNWMGSGSCIASVASPIMTALSAFPTDPNDPPRRVVLSSSWLVLYTMLHSSFVGLPDGDMVYRRHGRGTICAGGGGGNAVELF